MAKLFLALGTNLGDRESNIEQALSLLDASFGPRFAQSPTINTEACGFDGPDFLNCVVVYESRKRPYTILKICKQIEALMGRTDVPEYDSGGNRVFHDRIIDIDILLYGRTVVDNQTLTIPHPQILTRPYVKELLSSLPCSTPEQIRDARDRQGRQELHRLPAAQGGRQPRKS